ncbi:MAG: HIT family protein [Bacteroidales bacterium]|nr:HIT family protein [Bacteroidales bacterium]MDZ4205143.1 HIT family protein [Bacteroidales bacterium]
MESNRQCPFCSERIMKYVFDESEQFKAVYNRAPILPGHSMIIPKKHIESVFDFTGEEFSEFFSFARKVTQSLLKAFETDAFNWSLQEKEAGGQTVGHLHLHIIVRKQHDLGKPGDWYAMLQQSQNQHIDSLERAAVDDETLLATLSMIKNYQ